MTIPVTTAFSSITRIKTMLTYSDSTFYFLCGMEKESGKGIKEFLAHTFTLSPAKIYITEDIISPFHVPVLMVSGSKNKTSNDVKEFNEMTTNQIQNTFSSQYHSQKPSGLF